VELALVDPHGGCDERGDVRSAAAAVDDDINACQQC